MQTFANDIMESFQASFPVRRPREPFRGMLVISLALHAALALLLFSRAPGTGTAPLVSFIDLGMLETAKTPPAGETKAVSKAAPDIPQTPPPPAAPVTEAEQLRDGLRQTMDSAQAQPETLHQSSFALGITMGYFRSIGEGETLRDDIREYYFALLRKINEKWWLSGGVERQKGKQYPVIRVMIDRNGLIMGKQIIQESGDPAYDRAVMQALDAAAPLPPLPASYKQNVFAAPLRLVSPSRIMLAGAVAGH